MKIAIVGGGPGGLYFADLMKQLDPAHDITVWERNAPDDTFGFGVVFSDETLTGIGNGDRELKKAMGNEFAHWTDIDIHYDGQVITVGGQGFAAMSRQRLLSLLQRRCAELGIDVHYRTSAPDVAELARDYDLVLASDGLNSQVRHRFADTFGPNLDRRMCKYIWLATERVFEAFKFFIKKTEWGVMQIHGYPYSDAGSTFIVEMHEDTWRRAGFDATQADDFPPGTSDEVSIARLREIFAEELAGGAVLANNSKWLNFHTVRNRTWVKDNVVLLGDAAHTAHFSIGSGTKLAMEDAIALAACIHKHPVLGEALAAYEAERRPVVESLQRAAQASMEWFECIDQYADQRPLQFAMNLLTRSRRITFDNIKVRDAEFAQAVQTDFASHQQVTQVRPAMFQPLRLRGLQLRNRIVVSPMAMYSALDGVPGEFHLTHLGARAAGGAALVMTEMLAPSPNGRITPGCAGLWNDQQQDRWRRIVRHGHQFGAAMGAQLGHSGRKGSTKVMWEGIDEILPSGNWEVVAPSAIAYREGCHLPREITLAEMAQITEDYRAAAVRADQAGFDLLELHCAHGYLLSTFMSPLTNKRRDNYGGDLAHRLRYPLEVFAAVRQVWPADKPISVRISATDWAPGGTTADDACQIAAAFFDAGADLLDVSTGQVVSHEQPAYGRSYQTPFADRIRNQVALPRGKHVMAVGAISSYDDVNSILLAGRADLCAIGRSHLYNPHWTLHAAADQDYRGDGAVAAPWPIQYRAGRRKPPTSRTDAIRPRLSVVEEETEALPTHLRWRPGTAPAGG